jgi:hypothetical protein
MVDMEVATKLLVGGDTSLELADGRGVRELGRLRGDTEKDLTEDVVFEQMRPLR